MSEKDNLDKQVYSYFRQEISREDEITNQRMGHSMAFHGFLFTAATFLVSNGWDKVPDGVFAFRGALIGILGFAGLLVASMATLGVLAARMSIEKTHQKFIGITDKDLCREIKLTLDLDPRLPQIRGDRVESALGGLYVIAIHILLAFFWSVYTFCYMRTIAGALMIEATVIPLLTNLLTFLVARRAERMASAIDCKSKS